MQDAQSVIGNVSYMQPMPEANQDQNPGEALIRLCPGFDLGTSRDTKQPSTYLLTGVAVVVGTDPAAVAEVACTGAAAEAVGEVVGSSKPLLCTPCW